MADAALKKKVGEGFYEEALQMVMEYDFANDGGAQGDFDLAAVSHKILVKNAYVFVETACTSAGSATVVVGAATADADAFMDATSGAVASLTDNAVVIETTAAGLVVDSGDVIRLTIGTADLTAGKIKVVMDYVLVD